MSSPSPSIPFHPYPSADPNDWTPTGRFFNGTHFVIKGNPATAAHFVVCVHGIDGYHYNFLPLATSLVKEMKACVLLYDMLGRGFSVPHESGRYGEAEHIEQLHSLLEHLGWVTKSYHLIGLSMGGALSAIYASHFPEELKSLTLLAPAGLVDVFELRWIRILPWLAPPVRLVMDYIGTKQENSRTFFKKDGEFKAREDYMFQTKRKAFLHNPDHSDASWQCVMEFPLFGIEPNIKKFASVPQLPVHLIFGDKDVVVTYEDNFRKWKELLETGKCKPTYTVFPNGGHNILMEFPLETIDIITNFLKTI